jgi:hypothetical protein
MTTKELRHMNDVVLEHLQAEHGPEGGLRRFKQMRFSDVLARYRKISCTTARNLAP